MPCKAHPVFVFLLLVQLLLLLLDCESFQYGNRGSSGRLRCSSSSSSSSFGSDRIGAAIDTSIEPMGTGGSNKQEYGEDNFGDIMFNDQIGCETDISISSEFTNVERMILTANGNLQRIMSAYYGSPIRVEVLKSDPVDCDDVENDAIVTYDREVNLCVNGKQFCNAVTKVRSCTYMTPYYLVRNYENSRTYTPNSSPRFKYSMWNSSD